MPTETVITNSVEVLQLLSTMVTNKPYSSTVILLPTFIQLS